MKGFIICSVVMLAATTAMAATATMSLEVTGSVFNPVSGKNEISWDALPAAFTLNVMLDSNDPVGMSAFQVTLTGNSGFAYKTALRQSGLVKNYNFDLGWDQANGLRWAAGNLPMPGPPSNQVGTIGQGFDDDPETFDYGQDGLAAYVEFTAKPPKDVYEISGIGIAVGDSQTPAPQPMVVTLIPLLITPEPASALLLLGALPMLRRRR